ncbi:MAG: putative membrane protein YeaQ/YmgE (transglycosylase-associated protein family) [Bermanella sp.]
MNIEGLLVFLAIGAIAGWLASLLIKGGGYGLLGNVVIGVVGATIGGSIFSALGIASGGLLGAIATATVGAAVLLFIVRLIKRA